MQGETPKNGDIFILSNHAGKIISLAVFQLYQYDEAKLADTVNFKTEKLDWNAKYCDWMKSFECHKYLKMDVELVGRRRSRSILLSLHQCRLIFFLFFFIFFFTSSWVVATSFTPWLLCFGFTCFVRRFYLSHALFIDQWYLHIVSKSIWKMCLLYLYHIIHLFTR